MRFFPAAESVGQIFLMQSKRTTIFFIMPIVVGIDVTGLVGSEFALKNLFVMVLVPFATFAASQRSSSELMTRGSNWRYVLN